MPRFEMDESEESGEHSVEWWQLLDDAAGFARYFYSDIMQTGSDELKNAVNIILGVHPPAIYNKKGESA